MNGGCNFILKVLNGSAYFRHISSSFTGVRLQSESDAIKTRVKSVVTRGKSVIKELRRSWFVVLGPRLLADMAVRSGL